MTLFSSFSVTARLIYPQDAVLNTTVMSMFSVTQKLIDPSIKENVLCSYFNVTVPELAVIEANLDSFGLITHKKK